MRPRAFTLIELLVTISIISLLSSIVLASITAAREKARLGAAHQQDAVFQHSIGDQLVGWWPLNDCGANTTALNIVDQSYAAQLLANTGNMPPTWNTNTPFVTGCSLSFTPGSYLQLDAAAVSIYAPSRGTVRTFTAWFMSVGSTGSAQTILWKEGNCTGWSVGLGTAGTVYGRLISSPAGDCTSTDTKTVTSTRIYNDTKWHFVAFTVDRINNMLYLYLDGTPQGSLALTNPTYAITGMAFRAGDNWNATTYFNGLIDDIRAYSSALTLASIQDLYHTGLAIHLAYQE